MEFEKFCWRRNGRDAVAGPSRFPLAQDKFIFDPLSAIFSRQRLAGDVTLKHHQVRISLEEAWEAD
jgi:hypothetical protein